MDSKCLDEDFFSKLNCSRDILAISGLWAEIRAKDTDKCSRRDSVCAL